MSITAALPAAAAPVRQRATRQRLSWVQAFSLLTSRLCHGGEGMHRLPLPEPGAAAGGGAAGGAVCAGTALQQAEEAGRLVPLITRRHSDHQLCLV